ncbi:hypothetical protein HUT18_11510 [Streptomyces sp. NA04227]|uniref:hypothetical protein n=1 Tax=Streptomyces sp. NA04227 TaxID=2742136 RepID=UPI001591AAC1|nr:hypothetical protein [Streptomyces sp. NA04227]QKW06926.1 hypothetical protein HUT18_11510 [Streptomyces sp. NA04227]
MADMRNLWWAAGRMAFALSTGEQATVRWHHALRASATLLEPTWPKHYSAGPFTHALPTVALLLYARPLDQDPEEVSVDELVVALTPSPGDATDASLEHTVRDGLTQHGHDLEDDSPLSALFRQLTTRHPPLAYTATGVELSSADNWPGGTMMEESARWAAHSLAHHHISANSRT